MTAVTHTPEQILALAPDPASAKNGKDLATARKWVSLGITEHTLWGECKGSGSSPYRTLVDTLEPAFKCSCPSRKFPCKHALGLFLLHATDGKGFGTAAPPAWVAEWVESRAKKAEKKVKKEEQPAKAPDPVAQAKRAAERESKVLSGVKELQEKLTDLVRGGIASAPVDTYAYWDEMGARLVDAQAPGLARMVRELSGLSARGDGWQEVLVAKLGQLQLIIEGFQRLETLPPPVQADIKTLVGFTQSQDEVLAQDGLRDLWIVLGQRSEDDGRLTTQRTWLYARELRRMAMVLHFAVGKQPLDRSLMVGSVIDAELVYFPGNVQLRALVKNRHPTPTPPLEDLPGHARIGDAIHAVAADLIKMPWQPQHPVSLSGVVPLPLGNGRWAVRDDEGSILPISSQFQKMWTLMAVSGGHPLGIFGEWDGENLFPMGAVHNRRFMAL